MISASMAAWPVARPSPQSDLAQQIIKNPYNFDCLTIRKDARESESAYQRPELFLCLTKLLS